MLLALIFLPVALVVITIGLPVLILIASMGVMGIVVYNQICTKLSGFTVSTITTNQSSSSSVSSLRIVLPPLMSRTTYRYHDDQNYYSRSSSPPPSPGMMRMEYQMSSSSSLSPLQFRYKSNMEAPPSPTSSMHEINLDGRNSQLSRRRRVRFA